MCAIALADPGYQSAVNAKGFALTDTVAYGGKTYTHEDIAAMTDESYQRHRGEYALVCGGRPRINRKRTRQLESAVKSDVYSSFHISWVTVASAVLMGILAGPMGLVIAIVGAILSFYIEKDLSNDPQMMAAMGAA